MDMHSLAADASLMAKPQKSVPSKEPKPLYVGPWIRAVGTTQAAVSRETGINEGYLSEIISGGKKNPSAAKLMLIADFLKVPLGDLYKQPPSAALLEQVAGYDPAVVVRLSQKRRNTG